MRTPLLERDTDTDIEIISEEQFDQPPACESDYCVYRKRGSHEAHFLSKTMCKCNFVYLICRDRYEEYSLDTLIRCNCGELVRVENIVVVPL